MDGFRRALRVSVCAALLHGKPVHGLGACFGTEHDGMRQMLHAYPSGKRLDTCGSRFDGQPIRISDCATCSAVTFHNASRNATWKEPGPLDSRSAISLARLYSSDAAMEAVSGSATAR